MVDLSIRNVTVDKCSPHCFKEDESRLNILYLCLVAKYLWRIILNWLVLDSRIEKVSLNNHFLSFTKMLKQRISKGISGSLQILVCWCLLISRNNVLFNDGFKYVLKKILSFKLLSWEWVLLGAKGVMIIIFFSWSHSPLFWITRCPLLVCEALL